MYTPIVDLSPAAQFEAGKQAFYKGVAFSFEMPKSWRHGWNQAFSDVMREHEASKSIPTPHGSLQFR